VGQVGSRMVDGMCKHLAVTDAHDALMVSQWMGKP
jgi:hypothetical protein